ncbi:hypothetical protein Echvi_2477 [Echinicola vietnamensis DSM 17526]|uniref:Outer membrane protein beta-barrel domain-containing protein n=2 Tax=Echinicola TaxID=390846 RepID=L0FXT3_ECHVK|nr:hypothetical protein Echvi_2477 [Echinicola vietnamensis DSM 17526]
MRKLLVLWLFFGITFMAEAQEERFPTRAVYAELGGMGLVYSVNYDMRFHKDKMDGWGVRAGLGGYVYSDRSLFTLPVQLNKLFGKENHFFEIGAGATLVNYQETEYSVGNGSANETTDKHWHFILDMEETPSFMGTINFGYRMVPDEPGFTWRANLTPIFNQNGFWPLFAGIGFGYAF